MKKISIALIVIAVISIILYTQLTIFVIQPIGAIPEGRTIVILRLDKTKFIDSADAICQREVGQVNLICRVGAMAAVANNSTILMRLPYSASLYRISTGGITYDR